MQPQRPGEVNKIVGWGASRRRHRGHFSSTSTCRGSAARRSGRARQEAVLSGDDPPATVLRGDHVERDALTPSTPAPDFLASSAKCSLSAIASWALKARSSDATTAWSEVSCSGDISLTRFRSSLRSLSHSTGTSLGGSKCRPAYLAYEPSHHSGELCAQARVTDRAISLERLLHVSHGQLLVDDFGPDRP